ncbi:MAG: class I SAM-dependent methyltransferase [Actinobacteria bacterium]|nr:class I SAM-dependent methyltransferase [Actinomycetota bacterium]
MTSRPGSSQAHYDGLLAQHYDWMLGDLKVALEAQLDLLRTLLGEAGEDDGPRTALDLGCGTGLHSLALRALGYTSVTCLDVSEQMLTELRHNTHGLVPVTAMHADLEDGLPATLPAGDFGAAVCMGDTATHLSGVPALQRLASDVHRVLAPGGWFALSFRDLTRTPTGADRFIPVRSDESTILTCFLEDAGDHVAVHDIVHRRQPDGSWSQQVGSYLKLKLTVPQVESLLTEAGYIELVARQDARGMHVVAARTPR